MISHELPPETATKLTEGLYFPHTSTCPMKWKASLSRRYLKTRYLYYWASSEIFSTASSPGSVSRAYHSRLPLQLAHSEKSEANVSSLLTCNRAHSFLSFACG